MKAQTTTLLSLVILFSCNRSPSNLEQALAPPTIHLASMAVVDQTLIERKVIKEGMITFTTDDAETTKVAIGKACAEYGAYIESEDQNETSNVINYYQQIRVPETRFDQLLKAIEGQANRIEQRNLHTKDVTEEFIDVEARLKAQKELETRYLALLKQAKSVTEVIAIEKQLASTREAIESMESRLKYLNSQVSYGTLQITYHEISTPAFGFAAQFWNALANGWESLMTFLIQIVSVWPFLIFWAIFMWLTMRRVMAWRKSRQREITTS
jgi:hypothetical protein